MIKVILSKDEYEYDIYSLVKAFYLEQQVKVIKPDVNKVQKLDTSDIVEADDIKTRDLITENVKLKSIKLNSIITDNENLDKANLDNINSNLLFKIELGEQQIEIIVQENEMQIYNKFEEIKTNDKKVYRNLLKRMLYHCLAYLTKKELPWGTLTGVRPTKIALERLEKNVSKVEIQTLMHDEYFCSKEKIDLSLQVAERELKLLKAIDYRNGYSIYIGIPFCPSTCLYCSFTSYSYEKYGMLTEQYLQALFKEITYAKTCYPDKTLSTVYLGGGTPTTLTANQLERLLNHIRNTFDFSGVYEFTVEAGRPDSITTQKLRVLKGCGVTRISINPQSMRQKTLDIIGRKHTVEQVNEAFLMAREAGHDNINMDIILGLPGETKEDVAYTLAEIDKLQPDSLTVHTLAVKRAARLNIEKENYRDIAVPDTTRMLHLTEDYTKKAHYLPYYLYRQKNMSDNLENIGYAKAGKEGLYNILIMEERQTILALGAGGLSKFVFHDENRIERVENVKSLKDYIERIDEMIERKQNFLKINER
jgi:coproporphyrinogen dehydrogenase HemZ